MYECVYDVCKLVYACVIYVDVCIECIYIYAYVCVMYVHVMCVYFLNPVWVSVSWYEREGWGEGAMIKV